MLELNETNFQKEVLKSDKPVIIDFWAEWCGPCKMMGPVFSDLSKEMSNVKFAKLNVDDNNDLAAEYNVMGIPTFLIFNNGKEVARLVGAMSKADLKSRINSSI